MSSMKILLGHGHVWGQGVKSWLLRLETTLNFAEGEGNHRGLAAGGAVGNLAVQQVAE